MALHAVQGTPPPTASVHHGLRASQTGGGATTIPSAAQEIVIISFSNATAIAEVAAAVAATSAIMSAIGTRTAYAIIATATGVNLSIQCWLIFQDTVLI